jgi:gliding motility-associated-like protein
MGGGYDDEGYDIAVDNHGNVYSSGKFALTADFDPGPGTYYLTAANWAAYLSKLDSSGNFIWAKQIGGNLNPSYATIWSIALSEEEDIYFTGWFDSIVDFDPGSGFYNLTANSKYGMRDGFIGKLNSAGNFEWAKQIGGSKDDMSVRIDIDSNYLYATGNVERLVDFDPSDSAVYNFVDTGIYFYVLKWRICNTKSNINRGFCDSINVNSQTYKTPGIYTQVIPNHKGCDSTIIIKLITVNKPKAKFFLQSQAGCQYVEYIFTDSSFADTVSAAGYTYTWDYGDGTRATVNSKTRIPNFKHIYTKGGTYNVRLNFGNGFCNDSFSIINSVFILPAPKPGFTMNSHSGCTPFTLNIKDTSTTDIVLKEYDFGNGFVALKNNKVLDTTIQIASFGTHIIQQRLTGTTGCITQFSDTIYITKGLTKSDTVNILYTTVVDSNTTFTQWNILPNAVSYTIKNKNTIDTFFTDNNVQPYLSSLHYFVNATDSCGNKSAVSPVAQTIYLKGENENFNEFALLEYTPYETWKQGVMEYQIEYFNNANQAWTKLNAVPGNVFTAKPDVLPDSTSFNTSVHQTCYRVIAMEQNGNMQRSISNVACVSIYPVVFIPNAFSPNGDGINDYYKPICAGLNAYIFEIYDRWGQLVYSDTPESKGWDGTFRGKKLEAGAYVFRLSAIGFLKSPYTNDAKVVERKGMIYLVR